MITFKGRSQEPGTTPRPPPRKRQPKMISFKGKGQGAIHEKWPILKRMTTSQASATPIRKSSPKMISFQGKGQGAIHPKGFQPPDHKKATQND